MEQHIFCNRWRCLMSKASTSFHEYIYICLLTHEVVPAQTYSRQLSLKSNALFKKIMQIRAASLQSLFNQSFFIHCSRRHLIEKPEGAKKKSYQSLRERLVFYALLMHLWLSGRTMRIDYSKNQFLRELISNQQHDDHLFLCFMPACLIVPASAMWSAVPYNSPP